MVICIDIPDTTILTETFLEITADERSKAEYDRQLSILKIRKEDTIKRLQKNGEWLNSYDSDIGPVTQK